MKLDYKEIGKRIARRRKKLDITQEMLAEWVDISLVDVSPQYISHIEHARSIPSTEVIMRLALVLDTTPDEFLVGTARYEDQRWRTVAERLRGMSDAQLDLMEDFAAWVLERRA